MPVVGSRDVDRVDVFHLEDAAEVLVELRVGTCPFARGFAVAYIDIGNGGVGDVRRLAHEAGHEPSASAAANQGHIEAIVRADRRGGGEGGQACGGQESASLHRWHSSNRRAMTGRSLSALRPRRENGKTSPIHTAGIAESSKIESDKRMAPADVHSEQAGTIYTRGNCVHRSRIARSIR